MQNISNSTISVRYPTPFVVRVQQAPAAEVGRTLDLGVARDLIQACAKARQGQRAEGFVWFLIALASLAALGMSCWL
jgi:hypothetical protein